MKINSFLRRIKGGHKMKIIRNISKTEACIKLENAANEKFYANEMASSCLCRCSDG